MTKGSLFTGAMGADIGAEAAGMVGKWYCENDPSAAGIIAFHAPHKPIYCDINQFKPDPINDSVDVIFGGSPCQDLSVAGKRKGLDGSRSGLFHQMVRIAKRLRPRFVVWENVPGAFSSNGGRDFACVIRAFTGLQVEVPRGGWGNAGFVRTPFPSCRWNVAWRVLDSQYCGVPQRRRRIFLVASFGDASCAEILFEPESVRGDHPPRREAGQNVAPTISARTKGGGGLGTDFDLDGALIPDVARCLSTSNQRIDAETETFIAHTTGAGFWQEGAGTLRAREQESHEHLVAHTLRAEGFDASEDGTGIGTPLVVTPILEAGARTGVSTDDPRAGIGIGEPVDPMFTLQATKQHAVAFSCKDHGADVGEVAPTLRSMGHDASHANGGGQIAVAYGISPDCIDRSGEGAGGTAGERSGLGIEENLAQTLRATHVGAVAFRTTGNDGCYESGDKVGCLNTGTDPCQNIVAFDLAQITSSVNRTRVETWLPASTLNAKGDMHASGAFGVRRLTPKECERLQSWPDSWTRYKRLVKLEGNRWIPSNTIDLQKDGPRYKQCGNGVTASVAQWIAQRILKYATK